MKNLILCLFASLTLTLSAQTDDLPVADGKFKPTDESLEGYTYPAWFRDAKFGIWSVWGPMAVPCQGDWYSRRLYQGDWYDCEKAKFHKGDPAYADHLKRYGHPSEFGFKDLVPLWKAEKWNPEALMKLYKRAGAKYFCTIATHHDNFFLWNSKLHRWNAANMGPKKDVLGIWQATAKKEGLYFGVTEHLGASYTWFQQAHKADQLGDKAGVPYDGANPAYYDLYHEPTLPGDNGWLTNNPKFQREWYDHIQELVDMYHPDLLYSDSGLPFGDVGRSLIAHYYNQSAKTNRNGVVYTCKEVSEGRWVRDYERGSAEGISNDPWQTDTSIGDWIYREGDHYKSATQIIQMLVDIVSKNGNLLLCIPQKPDGELDAEMTATLNAIGDWMEINGGAIYGTRPWTVYGEGPSVTGEQEKGQFHGVRDVRPYREGDFRFTTKGKTLYAFCMEPPTSDVIITSLGLKKPTGKKMRSVKMLGSNEKLVWTQDNERLTIRKPTTIPVATAVVFVIE